MNGCRDAPQCFCASFSSPPSVINRWWCCVQLVLRHNLTRSDVLLLSGSSWDAAAVAAVDSAAKTRHDMITLYSVCLLDVDAHVHRRTTEIALNSDQLTNQILALIRKMFPSLQRCSLPSLVNCHRQITFTLAHMSINVPLLFLSSLPLNWQHFSVVVPL